MKWHTNWVMRAENEANFIGFLATVKHPDPIFNLSGYGFALRYCLNELYYRDKAQFEALYEQINPGLIKHFKAQSQFWAFMKILLNRFLSLPTAII